MPTTTERVAEKRPSASRRLLDAASDLFYAEGVQSVGIDRIIEWAGVAKASLYNTFGSKDALVRAYLNERHAGTTGRLTAAIASTEVPRERILAVFAAQAELFAEPGFRGCAFVAASIEAPPGGLVEQATDDYRARILGMFRNLAATPEPPTRTCSPPNCRSSTTVPDWASAWTVDPTSPSRPAQR